MTQDNRHVEFLAYLQQQNRFQIPVEIRQRYKLEPKQLIKVEVKSANSYEEEQFFANVSSNGRITVPWEVRWKLKIEPGNMLRIWIHFEDQE